MQKIVNFTGMDGSGKTTALQHFARIMRTRGFTVLEVSTTYFDPTVLDFMSLFEKEMIPGSHVLERYIHTMDLHMVIKELAKKGIANFDYVLYDRHFVDKRVFFELRTGKEWPPFFDELIAPTYYPQINLYFKINPSDAFLRLSRKRQSLDWKEKIESLEMMPQLYAKYLHRDTANRIDIDASVSENLVLNQVMEHLAGVHFE